LIEERLGSERDPAFDPKTETSNRSLYPTATPACGSSLVAMAERSYLPALFFVPVFGTRRCAGKTRDSPCVTPAMYTDSIEQLRDYAGARQVRVDFRDGAVLVSARELFVVPKGVEHKQYAEHDFQLLLIEPRGVPNTGHEGGDRTAENDVSIRAMKFGIHNSSWLNDPNPAQAFETVKAKAQWAENHGFIWFSVMDHMIQIPRVESIGRWSRRRSAGRACCDVTPAVL
jgi:hypothetical protein